VIAFIVRRLFGLNSLTDALRDALDPRRTNV